MNIGEDEVGKGVEIIGDIVHGSLAPATPCKVGALRRYLWLYKRCQHKRDGFEDHRILCSPYHSIAVGEVVFCSGLNRFHLHIRMLDILGVSPSGINSFILRG